MKHNATSIYQLLEAHYAPPPSKPPGGRLLKEIQAPDSTRRADALYLPITTGGRGTIIGHEIKVARSDVIAELRDPHKADSWMRYCSKWWLVVSDASIIDGLEIPDEWGIMAPPTKGRFMTTIRKAPPLSPQTGFMAQAWGTIFARVAYADIAVERESEWNRERATKLERSLAEAQAEVRRLTGIVDGNTRAFSNRVTVSEVMAAIERHGGYGKNGTEGLAGTVYKVNADLVARRILAEVRVDDRRDLEQDIQMAIDRAEEVAAELRKVRGALSAP